MNEQRPPSIMLLSQNGCSDRESQVIRLVDNRINISLLSRNFERVVDYQEIQCPFGTAETERKV